MSFVPYNPNPKGKVAEDCTGVPEWEHDAGNIFNVREVIKEVL